MLKKFLSFIRSFRGQLLLGFMSIIFFGFISQVYTFFLAVNIENSLEASKKFLENQGGDIHALNEKINDIQRFSFYFASIIVLIAFGILFYLLFTLNRALATILHGIQRFDEGNLSYRIILSMNNEFGTIAKFFNKAATHAESIVNKRTQELEAERNKLAMILEGVTDSVIALDFEGKIVTFNNSAAKMTGYNAREMLGAKMSEFIEFYGINEKISEEIYAPVPRNAFEGVIYSKEDIKLQTANGRIAFINLATYQISKSSLIRLKSILTIHDVTKERELEEMKLDFVAMAAHELRTPITAMRGYLSMIHEENTTLSTEERQTFIERIGIATQKLLMLVENILNVSHIERGTFTLNLESTDWFALVKHTVEEFQDEAKEKKISLVFEEYSSHLPLIIIDRLRIGEVLSNLIGNAVMYTKSGGSVRVSVQEDNGKITTKVADTGEGIPKEAIPNLFTKFFRVSGRLEQGSKGTGLGLFIAKSIVNMHSGEIWVESELGKGSIFAFSIPFHYEEKSPHH